VAWNKETALMKTSFMVIAILVFTSILSLAADLRNEDGKRYEVKVYDGGTTRNTWIDGNSTTMSICSSCEVEVVGVGRIKISGSDKLTIKGGKLVKQ
jgi:hypothetical protein